MYTPLNRRQWIAGAGVAAVSAVCIQPTRAAEKKKHEEEREVPAVEDLMREHGILRRALLVYSEAAARLAGGHTDIPLAALGRTAILFRDFGERYHEQALEEKHVFVPLINAGGEKAALARTLIAQHERGRQITSYISDVAKRGRLSVADVTPLSQVLVTFVRMYEHHAAIEDTIIFPTWKQAISAHEYHERTEQFEELEHEMFGKDGFEDALARIASIEREFGLADLDALTAPSPPKLA
jgi:hemerythrin-like domain-containing protein